jgi:hypothetical protein
MTGGFILTETLALPPAAIHVGERFRKDLGDLAGLEASIRELGILQPLLIDPDHGLIAGARRLEVAKRIGLAEVPVRVIETLADAAKRLKAERDENTCRKEMTASEQLALGRRLEVMYKEEADKRRKEGNRRGGQASSSQGSRDTRLERGQRPGPSKVTEEVAGDVSASTYARMRTVEKAQTDADPVVRAVAEEAMREMDAGLPVFTAVERVRQARTRTAPEKPPPPPGPSVPRPKSGQHERECHRIDRSLQQLPVMAHFLRGADWAGAIGDVSAEAAHRWDAELTTAIVDLTRARRALRRLSKGTP